MTKFSIPIYIFTGLAAICMASVAAFFSITGLAALYAAAAIPVIVMGSTIEFSKIVSTVWLHHFWKKANFLMVGVLALMVAASMAVTSGGVYGFLTGSHASQEAPNQQKQLIINRYDQQIKVEQDRIVQDQSRLRSLDSIVSTSLTQGKFGGRSADGINRRQSSERTSIQNEIDQSYHRIDSLSAEKLKVTQAQAESEVKLGAVKYLAALFGADPANAVMYFTLVMVLLLDPFAIILVIATQIAYEYHKKERLKNEIDKINLPDNDDEPHQTDKNLSIPIIPDHPDEAQFSEEQLVDAMENAGLTIDQDHIDLESDDQTDEDIPATQVNRILDLFQDETVQAGINKAGDSTIEEIGKVVNSEHITDNEKVEQVIRALNSTLAPEKMEEVKKRWLED